MSIRKNFGDGSSRSENIVGTSVTMAAGAASPEARAVVSGQAPAQDSRFESVAEFAEEHFRIRREPIQWPDNARIAVTWIVDYEDYSDTSNSYAIHYYAYSGKAGFWRLIDLFDENGVKGSWYTNGMMAARFPETLREAIRRGHEIDAHGWSNNVHLPNVSAEVEREIIRRTIGDIETASGVRPVGWLGSGWATTPHTLEYLVDEGIIWNGDYPIDDLPYVVATSGRKIVIIPYVRESNDIAIYGPHRHHPQVWLDNFKDAFDVLYQEGEKYPQFIDAAMHAWLLGHPVGKKVIREAIRYTKGFPNVWHTTQNEVARWWLKQNYE